MNEPITILVPVYNSEKNLKECIESILKQNFSRFKCLFLYDHSSDNTLSIIKNICQIDRRFEIINCDGKGLANALNKGLASSKSEFIARMDSDDIMYPDRLKVQLESALKDNADFTGSHFIINHSKRNKKQVITTELRHDNIFLSMYKGVPFAHGSILIRKSFLDSHSLIYDENVLAEDFDLWIRAFQCGAKFSNVDEILYQYNVHDESITSSHFRKLINVNFNLTKRHAQNNLNLLTEKLREIKSGKTDLSMKYAVLAVVISINVHGYQKGMVGPLIRSPKWFFWWTLYLAVSYYRCRRFGF